ncbi:Phospholipase A1, partial [Gryllus bimaculatus]
MDVRRGAGQEAAAEEGEEGEEGAEGGAVRWMLLPGGGEGRAQVAVLEGLQPRRAPDPDTVSFLLWTRENPRKAERLRLAAHCAPQPHFRRFSADRPSVLLVHGFGDSAAASYMYPVLRDAFLEVGDYNVLAVDWAALAAAPWYASAAANTRLAA